MSRVSLFMFSFLLFLNFYLPTFAHPLSQLNSSFGSPLTAKQTTPIETLASHVDGYCKYNSRSHKWYCERRGFVCEGFSDDDAKVCVDHRSAAQKEADRQEAADGKNGRCHFRYEDGYYCTRRGFVCVDGRTCEDRRTDWERFEDDRKEGEWKDKMGLIDFFSGFCGVFALSGAICYCCSRYAHAPTDANEMSQEEQGTGVRGEEESEDITLVDRMDKAEETIEAERCAMSDEIRVASVDIGDEHELPAYCE